MNQAIDQVFHLSATATGALVSAVWQGALLAALVYLVLRMLPRLSAAARSVIWLNVFVLLALLHILPVLTASAARPAADHALRLDPRWSVALLAVWLILSVARAAQLVWGAVHLTRMARNAVPVDSDGELHQLLLHHGHQVELCASEEVARPSVIGFFRPRVLVPPALLEQLSPAELKQVVVHEMEHLHRGDDWINLLQKLALVLFPLNPALAWVERRLCAERELACDDRVLSAGSGRKAYALCLTHLAEFALVRRGISLVLGAWERRPELVRRVHRILSRPVRSMGRRPAQFAMGSLTAGALACALALAHAPEIVRFTSVQAISAQARNTSPALDAAELGREMGGTPQLVKAVMPGPKKPLAVRPAVHHRAVKKCPLDTRLAALRQAPPPSTESGALLVMSDWSDSIASARVIIAVQRIQQARPLVTARATYAVVHTPAGWFVIQI